MIVGFPRMQRLWPRRPAGTPLWRFLVAEAEAVTGASIWYSPPPVHADTVTGNSDGSGGRPVLGTGPIGRVLSRGTLGNNATQATSGSRPIFNLSSSAAAAAAGFGTFTFDGVDDNLQTAGSVIDLNADWFMLCAFRATANSGFPWPFAANYTAGGQRAGMYLQADGRIFLALRRLDGSPVDADMRLALASAAGTRRVGYVEKIGSTLTAYNADGSVHLSQATTFNVYTAGGPARIGAGDAFFSGSVSMAALGNGTVTAQQRQALLSLANFVG